MNKQEIVLVGFKDLDINEAELIVTNLQNKINNSLNSKEIIFITSKLAQNIGLVIVNLSNSKLSIAENLFLQFAYTNRTPILGVGEENKNAFLSQIVLNQFHSVEDAIDHYKANYYNII